MALAEAPPIAVIREAWFPTSHYCHSRAEKILRKSARKLHRKELRTERYEGIVNQLFPDKTRIQRYIPHIDQVRYNPLEPKPDDRLSHAVEVATKWNEDDEYLHVRRQAAKDFRDVSIDAGYDPGKVAWWKISKVGACLESLDKGQGKIPTTSKDAARRIEEAQDSPDLETLMKLQDQLEIAEKTQGRKSSGMVVEVGASAVLPLPYVGVGVNTNVGIELAPANRRGDVFLASKMIVPGGFVGPVLGVHKRGIQRGISVGGFGHSVSPHKGEQDTGGIGPLGLAYGKVSGIKIETPPLALLAAGAVLVGAHEAASLIHSLGPYAYLKLQLVISGQDERFRPLQEKLARVSARVDVRLDIIKEHLPKIPKRKNVTVSLNELS